jgi:F420-dependent oxidoreductase-like protein
MRVCLMIEGQEGVSWEQWVALAEACEEHGLEGLFRSDHYAPISSEPDRGSLDAWAVLAALAQRTERIRLGTLVSPATFRHPSVLAKMVVTVDHASGGRAELGMGAGWYREDHSRYGFSFPSDAERMSMLAEQLEIVHRQWGEEEFSFQGNHYRLDRCRANPKPVQRPHPPLIVGGAGGPRSAGLAARWADEYNTVGATPDECARRRAAVAEAWEREERDPAKLVFSLMTGCVVGTDRDEVLRRAGRLLAPTGDREEVESALRQRPGWVVGTPSEAVARLRELQDAGVERVMLQHLLHADIDMVALIGAEIASGVG